MKKIGIILFVLLFTFVGCSGSSGGDSGPATGADSGFVGGTNGILINFLQDSPPEEVFDGGDNPFDIVLELENVGEHTVQKDEVQVSISGMDPVEFSLSHADLTKNPDDSLEATRKDSEGNVIDPIPVAVEFREFNHVDDLVTNNIFRIRAEVCYDYQTIAEAKICVKEDNLDTEDSVCDVNEAKTITNSGAPIHVENFQETPRSRNRIGFTFNVVHKGNGNIFKSSSLCENERKFEDKVHVRVETGLTGLDCSGLSGSSSNNEGFITMYSGERLVSCTQEASTQTDFVKPVVITLMYGYEENIETTVLVKHAFD